MLEVYCNSLAKCQFMVKISSVVYNDTLLVNLLYCFPEKLGNQLKVKN